LLAQKEKVVEKLDSLIQANEIPGIQVTYMNGPERIEEYTAGLMNYDEKTKVNSHTRFQAASMTKTVMAYIVLRLYDQGIIDIDAPLDKYIEYPRLKRSIRDEQITGRMALNHTIGFPNWTK